jgi:hypothetical protein
MPSQVIARIDYDERKHVLDITFLSGHVYRYYAVPVTEYNAMKAASSKGSYLNEHIKKKYAFTKIK